MIKPLKRANLPTGKCSAVCADLDLASIAKLNALGIDVISPIRNKELPVSMQKHADLLACYCGDGVILLDYSQLQNEKILTEMGFDVRIISKAVGKSYPNDVYLNACLFDDIAIININTICEELLTICHSRNIIGVKQGYSKCAIAVISKSAIITDDIGIDAMAKSKNIDSLLISKGDVYLEGFEYGFFGGCCGMISHELLAINGSLDYHRDSNIIKDFLDKHNVCVLELNNSRLKDIGSIIPLVEKA